MKVGIKSWLIAVGCVGTLYIYFILKPNRSFDIIDHEHLLSKFNFSQSPTKNAKHDHPSISLYMRMSGKRDDHRHRFYCNMLKTIPLFWPGWMGKMVLVLDNESEEDHTFGETLLNQTKKHFPNQTFKVEYEPLPKDPLVLTYPGQLNLPGYNRQLWNSFFIDLYADDEVIAWLDSDSPFIFPVTLLTIKPNGKVRILGSECAMKVAWGESWAKTTKLAIGLPQVADFMTYFPVYIYRNTFTHCREHILKNFNTSNFEEAYQQFHETSNFLSPVNVIISYAWFFEKDRYDWNIGVCSDLNVYNSHMNGLLERLFILYPCIGNHTHYYLDVLERHIKKVGVEIKENKRRTTWDDVTTVDSIARKTGVNSSPHWLQPLSFYMKSHMKWPDMPNLVLNQPLLSSILNRYFRVIC
ncbi:uncharacterized protein LOC124447146 [Xenia sp. Carnegie-2017]|uniref:uncharacterized protein LOC124447146 n=1 Tax=Xenia sp. Carnegie-2017 TaxID=2897299 RepID=UPI001F04E632|nr:uncharacterized protein LOC124447146 [Xenia sp. Carnegie-2017]